MQKQTILFNLDDTLVYCNRYFNRVIEGFLEQMIIWFDTVSKEEIRQKQLQIDLSAINKYGLKSERFPESFVETYTYFCGKTGKERQKSEMDSLRELGFQVFKIPVEPIPYMNETLQQLKDAGHKLYLHTGGDVANQRRKITQLELSVFFGNRIFISEYKDTTALSDILKTIHANPKITWMVGNSLKTDIKPALEMNINAIFIPAETEWKFDKVDISFKPKSAFITLNSLRDVPRAIHDQILKEEKNNEPMSPFVGSSRNNGDQEKLPIK
jgi:putative hydrolase of the HAD superfamily